MISECFIHEFKKHNIKVTKLDNTNYYVNGLIFEIKDYIPFKSNNYFLKEEMLFLTSTVNEYFILDSDIISNNYLNVKKIDIYFLRNIKLLRKEDKIEITFYFSQPNNYFNFFVKIDDFKNAIHCGFLSFAKEKIKSYLPFI